MTFQQVNVPARVWWSTYEYISRSVWLSGATINSRKYPNFKDLTKYPNFKDLTLKYKEPSLLSKYQGSIYIDSLAGMNLSKTLHYHRI